ncbi:MAG: hypothetical protein LJE89_11325 [Deltaproteobacteria bacterium]|nr:hypothetical protein [Deltaproteobacteria bacterium]
MAIYSEAELDVKAKANVFSLDRNLESANVVRDISDSYIKFCESSEAKNRSIRPRKITEGVELRLLFEALCFTAFLTTKISPRYIATKRLILKKVNYELVRYYNARLAQHLIKLCNDLGMTKLREIVLVSPPPEIKIKHGDSLNPMTRLKEYSEGQGGKSGTAAQHFGRNIGKALDPFNYHALETLGKEQVTALTRLSEKVSKEVFTLSVKLKA